MSSPRALDAFCRAGLRLLTRHDLSAACAFLLILHHHLPKTRARSVRPSCPVLRWLCLQHRSMRWTKYSPVSKTRVTMFAPHPQSSCSVMCVVSSLIVLLVLIFCLSGLERHSRHILRHCGEALGRHHQPPPLRSHSRLDECGEAGWRLGHRYVCQH